MSEIADKSKYAREKANSQREYHIHMIEGQHPTKCIHWNSQIYFSTCHIIASKKNCI